MKIIDNMKLGRKLTGGFLLVACIIAAAGSGVGYWCIGSLSDGMNVVEQQAFPSVQHALKMQLTVEGVKVSVRTLLSQDIDPEVRKRQFGDIETLRTTGQAERDAYDALPKTAEEESAWNDFKTTWTALRDANSEFLRIAKEYDDLTTHFYTVRRAGDQSLFSQTLRSAVATLRATELALQKQVHAWKDVVIRGGDSKAFDKHFAEFEQEEKAVQTGLESLQSAAARLGIEASEIATCIKLHAELNAKYREAIKNTDKSDSEWTAKIDHLVQGLDRPLAASFTRVAASLNSFEKHIAALNADATKQALEVCRPKQQAVDKLTAALVKSQSEKADAAVARGHATERFAKFMMIGCTVVGFILAQFLGIFLARSITRPVKKGVEFAERMAGGDLTQTLDIHQEDEIGQLAQALNKMTANLRNMFGSIASNTTVLAGSSTELSATATQLASGAEETTNQSATVAAAAEQMSANMTTMAASTEQMSGNVKTVASAVEEMTASIAEVARNAEQAATVANRAAELAQTGNAKIGELDAAAAEIGKVIDVIKDIADQTNLLALNATIEAARAGDAGKGFAVVATEVKELARQTATATEDIRRRIEGIQNSTGQVVQSIGEIGEAIKKVNEVSRTIASAVEEQSITTKEIARNVAQTSVAADTVAKGVAESASVTQEIARNVVQVDQAAKQTAQGATITQSASGKMTHVAEELQSLVGQFKTSA